MRSCNGPAPPIIYLGGLSHLLMLFFLMSRHDDVALAPLFSNLHEVMQRARPSHNPRGTCPCWSKTQPRRGGQSPSLDSYIARKMCGVGDNLA
jgi:hypothetical protein